MPEYDLLIAGAGMVGATLACLLAGKGFRIALADSQPLLDESVLSGFLSQANTAFDTRVSAITPASRLLLTQAGAWEGIAAHRLCPYRQMHVWEADGTGSIHFDAAEVQCPELGHIIENRLITACLHQRLRTRPDIDVLASGIAGYERVAGAGDRLEIELQDGARLRTTLLIAADGANSSIRKMAGFDTSEWDYAHHAIVTTVRTARPHENTAIQRFMDEGVLAFLPLAGGGAAGDGHECSIVWSLEPEKAEMLMSLPAEDFAIRLEQAIESRLGAIEQVAERSAFPLRQRHARDYVREQVVLIGDAAHTIHPLAGQGVNLGLQDALALSEVLIRAREQGRELTEDRVLLAYQRQRKGENLGMMWLMEGFRHLFADQPLPVRWLRNVGMKGVDSLPLLKRQLMRQAMGIGA